jgi:hypothetical protein
MAISSYLLELVLVDEESRPAPEYRHEQDITHFYRLDAFGDVLRDLIEFPHHDLKVLEAGGMLSLRLAERAGRRGLVVATVRPGLSELLDGGDEGAHHVHLLLEQFFGRGAVGVELGCLDHVSSLRYAVMKNKHRS